MISDTTLVALATEKLAALANPMDLLQHVNVLQAALLPIPAGGRDSLLQFCGILEVSCERLRDPVCDLCANPILLKDMSTSSLICRECACITHCSDNNFMGITDWTSILCSKTRKPNYYQRAVHFRKILRDVQGGDVHIPQDLLLSLREAGVAWSRPSLRAYLKRRKLTRFYPKLNSILACLGWVPGLKLTSRETEHLCGMFDQVSTAFDELGGCGRKNFISYVPTLVRLCERAGYAGASDCTASLKCVATVAAQDLVWNRICVHLGWLQPPSVGDPALRTQIQM